MALNDLPADRQTHPCSWVSFPAMQPLKHPKDPLRVPGLNPDSIVLYSDDPFVPLLLRPQMNPGRLWPPELQRVPEQVLHYLADLPRFMTTIGRAVVAGGAFVFSIEHPVYTAPIAPRFVTDDAGQQSWLLDHYSVEGARTTDWLAPGVVKYHRTITTYLSCLQDAGFTLDQFCEWAPRPDEIVEFPEWTIELDRPQFLLIGARRT